MACKFARPVSQRNFVWNIRSQDKSAFTIRYSDPLISFLFGRLDNLQVAKNRRQAGTQWQVAAALVLAATDLSAASVFASGPRIKRGLRFPV